MKTYTQFRDGISNLLFHGWNIGDPILPDYREIIEYLVLSIVIIDMLSSSF